MYCYVAYLELYYTHEIELGQFGASRLVLVSRIFERGGGGGGGGVSNSRPVARA